jgi:hypothetical protein
VGFKLDDNFINEYLWQAAVIANQLMPYVNDYTCEELNKKFSDRSYQIIKKI